jgi:hypothetical protein
MSEKCKDHYSGMQTGTDQKIALITGITGQVCQTSLCLRLLSRNCILTSHTVRPLTA